MSKEQSVLGKQDYRTPRWFFEGVEKVLRVRFTLDAAADQNNTLCADHYSMIEDGLKQPWRSWTWCNPPYRNIGPWVRKALAEQYAPHHACSALLLPARTETRWFYDLHKTSCVSYFHVTPRLNFVDPDTLQATGNVPVTSTLFVVGKVNDKKMIGHLFAKPNKEMMVSYLI